MSDWRSTADEVQKKCDYCTNIVLYRDGLRRPLEFDGNRFHMCRGPKATPWKHDARKPPKPAEGRKRDPSKPKPPCPL